MELFIFGVDIFNNTEQAFDKMTQAIVTFENTSSFNRFTSKYDYFLAGRVNLSEQEQEGRESFEDEKKGNCAACHIILRTVTDADFYRLTFCR